jgi:glycosyltransferase involved in cell wall biosynthesis
LRKSALTIAPLNIARGTQNKVLESMAMGVPVVASPAAAAGVDAKDEEHFLVAASPAEYAGAILRLLDDPAERRRLAIAGRERVLAQHSWSGSMQRFDAIVGRCVSKCAR